MPYRRLHFVVLMLAALTLTMEAAHVLELPQKMNYDAGLYSAVNTSMYRYFALVGAPLTMLTLLGGMAMAILLRHQQAFRWVLIGVLAYGIAFIVWLTVVAPVNHQIADAVIHARATLPQLWMAQRRRWEYGHVAGFVLQFAGLACLIWSALAQNEGLGSFYDAEREA